MQVVNKLSTRYGRYDVHKFSLARYLCRKRFGITRQSWWRLPRPYSAAQAAFDRQADIFAAAFGISHPTLESYFTCKE